MSHRCPNLFWRSFTGYGRKRNASSRTADLTPDLAFVYRISTEKERRFDQGAAAASP
jgi:hypothetical protein